MLFVYVFFSWFCWIKKRRTCVRCKNMYTEKKQQQQQWLCWARNISQRAATHSTLRHKRYQGVRGKKLFAANDDVNDKHHEHFYPIHIIEQALLLLLTCSCYCIYDFYFFSLCNKCDWEGFSCIYRHTTDFAGWEQIDRIIYSALLCRFGTKSNS